MYTVDPRRTESAEWADVWLGIDVGSDIALSNTVAREIIHAGLVNTEFVTHSTSGFDEFAAHVESCTLEWGERITGVPAEAIRSLAHDYAKAPTAQLCWTLGITEHANATDNVVSLNGTRWTIRVGLGPDTRAEQRPGRRRHGFPAKQTARIPGRDR